MVLLVVGSSRSGGVASAGATRANSPHMRPSRQQPSSPSRAQSARLSPPQQSAPLSYRARSAKAHWEAAHGEPCPYAYACPRTPAKRKRPGHPAVHMHNNSSNQRGGVLPTGAPGAQSQYYGFGRGFSKKPSVLTALPTSTIEREAIGGYINTCGADPGSAANRVPGARWREGITASKKSGGVGGKVSVKPGRRRRVAPTLLEMHQRVIDAALLEISRPREGPFENLGERLGGEHKTFTYSSLDGGGEGADTESSACGPAILSEATTPKRRASTVTGKRRTPTRTRDQPRPSTGPRFSKGTAHRSRQMDLPRCNEPWKIPLLRTSWTPSKGDPVGDIQYGTTGLLGSCKEGQADAPEGSAEYATQSNAAAGASTSTYSDGVKEQSADKILRPCTQSTASLPIEKLSVSRIAASQIVEEMVSKALSTWLLEAEFENKGTKGQAHAEGDALSGGGASEAGGGVSRTAAKNYVEGAVSYALRRAFLAVSAKENLSMIAADKIQKDGARSREQVVALESKVMALECCREYLRRGLRARQAGASAEEISNSQLQVDAAQTDAFGKGCHSSGERGATTPTSGITSSISSESSAIEFVLNDDSSTGTHLGDEMQCEYYDGTGTGNSCSWAGARTHAVTLAVEEWVSGVVSRSARATTRQTSAGVKPSPSLVSDERDTTHGTGSAARHTALPEVDPNNHRPGSPLGGGMKMLPLGFLKDIVERRASLKPVVGSRPTSASVKDDRRLELDSRQQRERCAQLEATERASALRHLESLARAEGLDRYDPGAFSRGVLYGEGRHSVVYSAYAARPCGQVEEKEYRDTRGAASTGEAIRHATAATMAREASVEVLTIAVAAEVARKTIPSVSTIPMIVSTALVESVIPASTSAVFATTLEMSNTVLAAKEFRYARADVPVSILRKALQEASMHLRVSSCTHVVALRGLWLTPRVTLLLEPMSGGNLHCFVRHRAAEEKSRNDNITGGRIEEDKRRPCRSAEAASLVAEAAEGLAALHRAGVVHRDVKSHNVMVVKRHQGITESTIFMPGCEAKLGDLGSATLVPPEGLAALTEETGTSGWMAPEVFGGQGYGTPADVFSLGVLIWDAFVCGARDNPLCGLSGEACQLRDGLRPPWPRPPLVSVPPNIERLAERCWVSEPGSRPTAGAVANELRSFAANVGTELAEVGIER